MEHRPRPDLDRAPLALRDGIVRLEVYVETTSVEVYTNDGRVVITDQVFPADDSDRIAVFAERGTARLLDLAVTPVMDDTALERHAL
jgi:fructan beta-fructosidase